jgi:uncharacterized cupin superfamily protein
MPKPVRRVVTANDGSGKAVAAIDGLSPHVVEYPGYAAATMVWQTAETPAGYQPRDRALDQKGVAPPPRGTTCRIVEFPPHDEARAKGLTHRDVFRGVVAPDETRGPARHAHMHRTLSVDYAIVLEGEIDMLLDVGEVHLAAGDILIQQATNHAWVNRSGAMCRIAFVLIDGAKEVVRGPFAPLPAPPPNDGKPVRRVITGHDAQGRAVVLADGINPNVHVRPTTVANNLWSTPGTPAPYRLTDPVVGYNRTPPPSGGTLIRITQIPPWREGAGDHAAFTVALGVPALAKPRHPFMHRTDTVDYGFVLEGEIEMWLDDSEVRLKPGDVVVQQQTNHAWVNRSGAPCRMAFVLIDGVKSA